MCQNKSGGVKVRIENYVKNIVSKVKVKRFDKWTDNILDFDIVHIFKSSAENYSLVKYAEDNGIPVVVSSVVPSTKRFVILANRILCSVLPVYTDWFMNGFVLRHADAICAQTEKEKRFIARTYKIPANKIWVIPNGVSLSFEGSNGDAFSKATNINQKYVLQVGRFDSNKNQLNTIKAVKGTNIQLVLIGGPDKNEPGYYEQCREIAGENVHFLGWIDHDDPVLKGAYENATVVVLPSYKEIFGNSLFEGGAFGANLVVSNALPVEEWGISQYCDMIDPSSVSDIKGKLSAAIQKDKNRLVEEIIRSSFTWDKVTDDYIAVYKEVLKKKRNG